MTKKQINVIWLNAMFLVIYAVWIMLTQGGWLSPYWPGNQAIYNYDGFNVAAIVESITFYSLCFMLFAIATIKLTIQYVDSFNENSNIGKGSIIKYRCGSIGVLWGTVYIINFVYTMYIAVVATIFTIDPHGNNIWEGVYHGIVFGVIPMAIFVVGLIGFIKTLSQIVKCNKKRNSV